MLKNSVIRLLAYSIPIGVILFYKELFGKLGFPGFTCTFYKYTHWYCPGCGGQRAFQYLLQGDFKNAAHSNILSFLIVPFLLLVYVGFVEKQILGNKRINAQYILPTQMAYFFLAGMLVFFVVRNIPYAPFNLLIPQS